MTSPCSGIVARTARRTGRLTAAALVAAAVGSASGAEPAPKSAPSLCRPGESAVLRWAVKSSGKLVSLCASPDFGKDRGYLQYRFGRPGAIELEFPATTEGTHAQFAYRHYFRARFDETSLSFVNHGTRYTVGDDYDGEGGKSVKTTSVTVGPADGKGRTIEIECRELAPSNLAVLGDALPNRADDE